MNATEFKTEPNIENKRPSESEFSWGAEEWRQPVPAEGDTVIFSEPGRILRGSPSGDYLERQGVDCRSHSFKLVRGAHHGRFYILVRHGGGDERVELSYSTRIVEGMATMDSDSRYWLLHEMLKLANAQRDIGQAETRTRYSQAFAEGRLKKRRKNNRIYVEIQERAIPA